MFNLSTPRNSTDYVSYMYNGKMHNELTTKACLASRLTEATYAPPNDGFSRPFMQKRFSLLLLV